MPFLVTLNASITILFVHPHPTALTGLAKHATMGKGAKLFDSYAQFFTVCSLVIHFTQCLLCLANYLDWVRHQQADIGNRIVNLFLALTIIAIITFLLCSSVFYMWACRYASSEDAAKRRRIWGIGINLLFADFPLFCTQVDIVWNVGFASGLQTIAFLFTCLSFGYSGLVVWLYLAGRVIKRALPHKAPAGGGVLPPSPPRNDAPFGLSNLHYLEQGGAAEQQAIDMESVGPGMTDGSVVGGAGGVGTLGRTGAMYDDMSMAEPYRAGMCLHVMRALL